MTLRGILLVVGLLMTAMGMLWIGQALGYARWPESSLMIDQPAWATRGSITAVAGLVLVLVARRVRR
ncbi:hypothetical protein [Sphingomonas sp.]|uniref:hypothetical protein n=1 Tax=Sphingomonas sp. TaxID=28214 RepID=UPI002DD680E7|nr:hypothetical protein [Sphingomonas sp.]